RRLGNEGAMVETRIVQNAPECRHPDRPLANMLVAVQLGTSRSLRVIHVPHPHRIEANEPLDLADRLLKAAAGDNVIARHVAVTGVEACPDRRNASQMFHQLAYLLKVR